jgi:RP/EB family microtubule-associated protein
MTESRQELVNWVNELLLLDLTKVEQCGTGAVYCQIYDSIFLDVPMNRVRFDVNSEYQYLNNFKILQSTFMRHGIDRSVPVERLVKCRFQDNLEFLQYTRRFWDANFPGHDYDPLARRKSAPPPARSMAPMKAPAPRPARTSTAAVSSTTRTVSQASRPSRPSSAAATGLRGAAPSAQVNVLKDKIKKLEEENEGLIQAIEVVESERDFYFQKLRDVEVLIQTAADQLDGTAEASGENGEAHSENGDNNGDNISNGFSKLALKDKHGQLVRDIQTILYSTAEGFEIPTQDYETEETF